jgi:hypothetical protein
MPVGGVGRGFGHDRCAEWWLDRTRRIVNSGLALKPPLAKEGYAASL